MKYLLYITSTNTKVGELDTETLTKYGIVPNEKYKYAHASLETIEKIKKEEHWVEEKEEHQGT